MGHLFINNYNKIIMMLVMASIHVRKYNYGIIIKTENTLATIQYNGNTWLQTISIGLDCTTVYHSALYN